MFPMRTKPTILSFCVPSTSAVGEADVTHETCISDKCNTAWKGLDNKRSGRACERKTTSTTTTQSLEADYNHSLPTVLNSPFQTPAAAPVDLFTQNKEPVDQRLCMTP
jgi:hypothetical protein